jgi:hypothetical protein
MVSLGAAVAAAGEADLDAQAAPRGLLSGLFGEKPKTKTKADKAAPVEAKPAPPNTVDSAIAEQQRQMNAVLRRMEVCDRLRMAALQTGNEQLMRQADELEARAREIYNRQTAHLPISNLIREPSRKTAEKQLAAQQTSRARGADSKELDALPPTPQRRPSAASERLGGNFEQREQSILNDTSMGRDKP